MRNLLLLLCLAFTLQSKAQENQIKFPSGNVEMKWLHLEGLQYAALLIPVSFENSEEQYYMQFDLGTNKTVFYQNAPTAKRFKIGNAIAELDSISIHKMLHYNEKQIIGTIGMDLLKKSSLELNFKENLISFNHDISTSTSNEFYYVMDKILLPVKINNEEKVFLYDSGSSAFDLITDEKNWKLMRDPSAKEQIFDANSWGKSLKIHLSKASIPINIGNETITIDQIAYVEGMSESNMAQMTKTGMQGMIGNTIFMDKVLYFDFENLRYGITSE